MRRETQCPNLATNLENCGCTYPSCERKGRCCECIRFHRERNELPGCLLPPDAEKSYDRSVELFVASNR